jgi:hypothetical protein
LFFVGALRCCSTSHLVNFFETEGREEGGHQRPGIKALERERRYSVFAGGFGRGKQEKDDQSLLKLFGVRKEV